MADIVVVALVLVAVALAIRSLRREGVSCGGDCGSCAGGCASPKLRLSRRQRRELRALDRRFGDGR